MQESICNSQQILVPARFPYILKTYAKDAIRTQPYDLLLWSASYFRCLADNRSKQKSLKPNETSSISLMSRPAKTRVEIPPNRPACGLTKGLLEVLVKQIGAVEYIPLSILKKRWTGLCLCEKLLENILQSGNLLEENENSDQQIKWMDFLKIAAGRLDGMKHRVGAKDEFLQNILKMPENDDVTTSEEIEKHRHCDPME